jgi:hypothetical protein
LTGKCHLVKMAIASEKRHRSQPLGKDRKIAKMWGYSSVGRALQWHCRGRRFEPD